MGGLIKELLFMSETQHGYCGAAPLHWPLGGEAVHVRGLSHGKLTSDFIPAKLHNMSLDSSVNTHVTFCRSH